MTRGDLDQLPNGAADQPGEPYPDHPEISPSEPALANDHGLREESAAASTGGASTGGASTGGASPAGDGAGRASSGSQPGQRNPGDPEATGGRLRQPPRSPRRPGGWAGSAAR